MAGFDFEFTYTAAQEPIVAVCLKAAKARARALGITLRCRTLAPRHVEVALNGNSRRTDLLGYRLERDLPLVAEGCDNSTLSPRQRQRLGRGLADLFLIGRHVDVERCQSLRGVARTRYYYPPYEFDCPDHPVLHARLAVTEEMIVNWNFKEIAPEVFLEELHTACELLLDEIVPRRAKRRSFAELVADAKAAGLLIDAREVQLVHTAQVAGLLVDHEHSVTPEVLLTELKDLRKNVRHRASPGAQEWLDEHWEEVALLIERVVQRLNDKAARTS